MTDFEPMPITRAVVTALRAMPEVLALNPCITAGELLAFHLQSLARPTCGVARDSWRVALFVTRSKASPMPVFEVPLVLCRRCGRHSTSGGPCRNPKRRAP